MKSMVVGGCGVSIGVQLWSAQTAECRIAQSTLKRVREPRNER